jgi:GAF domain-containing protein
VDVDDGAGVGTGEHRLAEFAGMARQMNGQGDLEATLGSVMAEARKAQLGEAFGVFLVRNRVISPSAASEPAAQRAGQLQLECGEGPGVEAIMRRRAFVSSDLRVDAHWRSWAPQAAQLGWRSTLVVGLTEGQGTFGALTAYSRRTSAFSEADLGVAEVFAVHASDALTHARERASLAEALDGRNLIGQAQGILMQRYQIDAEQAFSVLRRYSSHSNRKLRHIAEDVVQRRLPPMDPAPEDHEPRLSSAPTDGAAAGAFTQRGHAGTTGEGRK